MGILSAVGSSTSWCVLCYSAGILSACGYSVKQWIRAARWYSANRWVFCHRWGFFQQSGYTACEYSASVWIICQQLGILPVGDSSVCHSAFCQSVVFCPLVGYNVNHVPFFPWLFSKVYNWLQERYTFKNVKLVKYRKNLLKSQETISL